MEMNMNDTYLTADELADRWKLPAGTLASWRSRKVGPKFVKIGDLVRYRVSDVEQYENRNA
jgi:predicted DNA-binding transcriptional regulator AlpA